MNEQKKRNETKIKKFFQPKTKQKKINQKTSMLNFEAKEQACMHAYMHSQQMDETNKRKRIGKNYVDN